MVNPAALPLGADAGGARAREQNVPGQAAGEPPVHPHDYLMNLVTNLARNAQYAERMREQDARAMNQMAVNMHDKDRILVEGIRQIHHQQQQQQQRDFNEFGGNGRGGFGGRGGAAFRPAAPAAPPRDFLRPPKIDGSFFPIFELPKREAEYFDAHQLWCRQVRNIIQANPGLDQLAMPALHAGILASLQGSASVMCQHIVGATFPTTDALLAAIGNATCSGAIQEKANNLFFSRTQRADEDIGRYCAR